VILIEVDYLRLTTPVPMLAQGRKIVMVARNLAISVVVPDEILTATRMTEAEMRQEIAVMLFQREKLTLAQASRFAGIHRVAFQHLLASRHIPVHYGVEDFEQDIQTLRETGRL
jgi:predicted HTH domain antitoxin